MLDRGLQVSQGLAGVGAYLEPIAQGVQLVRELLGIGLQRARRLQRDDVGAHLRGESEAEQQHGAHEEHQHRTDDGGDQVTATLYACKAHFGESLGYLGSSKRTRVRTPGTSTAVP